MKSHNERHPFFSRHNKKILLLSLGAIVILGIIFFVYKSTTGIPATWGGSTYETVKKTTKENDSVSPDDPQIKDGKHVQTGLTAGEGMYVVIGTCTACHSSDLILQNRYSREGWKELIIWMQETQGLWDLGENENIILDYLATHYAPEKFQGRRQPLSNIQWYELKE